MNTLDGILTARRDGTNRDDRVTCVALVRAAAILLAVTLLAGCASTDASGDLRPASEWHLYDQNFGRWW